VCIYIYIYIYIYIHILKFETPIVKGAELETRREVKYSYLFINNVIFCTYRTDDDTRLRSFGT
jgi:hypothetical protein